MKIAYLILAHADPLQLRRLVDALTGEHVSLFIHIDKGVDDRPFVSGISRQAHARFVVPRVKVNTGGFSMVKATLSLMEEALTCGRRFDYLVLLSGSHYPIKSNQWIRRFFENHRGREFIRYVDIREAPFLEDRINRIRLYDHPTIDLLIRALRKSVKVTGLVAKRSVLFERRFIRGFIPYAGSQWWAITQECATYVLRFVDTNERFVNFYRFATIPDEMFFQTIIMNSDFAAKTNQRTDHTYWREWGSRMYPVRQAGDLLTYVDWSLEREDPAILDERDFGELEKSDCLFARKFSTLHSVSLIARIDESLRKS